MDRHIDAELQNLKTSLLKMAALTERAIHSAIEALTQEDKALAKKVIADDQIIDELGIEIEEHVIKLLALFHPMAKDLRFITTGMQINMGLERIADLVVNICQRTLDIADKPMLKPYTNIPRLAETAKRMVRHAIDSFVNFDDDLAKKVIFSDKEANELRTSIIHVLINDYMIPDGTTAHRAVPLLLIARDLERICDHAAAIAEDVIYLKQAKIVRHHRECLE